MSLLHEIISQASDYDVPLTTILRKCLIVASRLRNEPLKAWVLGELEGFPKGSRDDLPPHRVFGITAKGLFVGAFGAQINDQPLPSGVLDEKLRWWATTAYANQGVAAYEAMIEKDATGTAMLYWPADMVARYQSKFFEGYALNRAWQEIPIGGLAEMLDTVRTKVLQFALELEAEGLSVDKLIQPSQVETVTPAVTQIFNTVVLGGPAVVGSKADNINIAEQQVVAGDFASLAEKLRGRGIHPAAVEELRQLLPEEEPKLFHRDKLSEKLSQWVQKAATTVAKEGGKAALDVAKSTISAAIMAYLGLSTH